MDSYKISFRRSAEKELRKVPHSDLRRVMDRIGALSGNPRPAGAQMLKGEDRYYRIRPRDYRVIYELDDPGRQVIIIKVGHRREVYR